VVASSRPKHPIYGYLAKFESEGELLDAVHAAKSHGYTVLEAYTPLPSEPVVHALGYRNPLPLIVACCGVLGALVGFGLQYYVSVIDYPINVGGRPLNSWPSFIVVTFELTILFSALGAVLGMLALNGLPQPYHPVFHVPEFKLASNNRFFLMVLSRDPKFDMHVTQAVLAATKPVAVFPVPH